MVIARLLTPAEIGVFSVTMVLLMFVATVRDMGAGQYLVQEKNLTTERIRAVWAVQLGLGLSLALLMMLVSYPVSVFYEEPRMRDIMLVVALTYAINPFGSLTYAWLMREMRFESVALMRFSAGLIGALVSIWLAWESFGPISLAFGSLASAVVNALVAIYFRPKWFPWLPGIAEIRRVLSFGSKITGSSVANVIARGAPELLLGKLQSITAVGLFSRASGLVQMFHRLFVDAVVSVCMPWFAKNSREYGGVVDPFLKATSYVTVFGWSFCLAIVCLAHPIVRVLYGNQWDQSVDLARLLAVAMIFRVPVALCPTALLASGAASTIARVALFSAIQSVTLVSFGASRDLFTLGYAMIAAEFVNGVLWYRATAKQINLPTLRLLSTLGKSAAVALLSALGPVIAFWLYGPSPEVFVMPLILGGVGGVSGFLVGVIVFQHPLNVEIKLIYSRLKRHEI